MGLYAKNQFVKLFTELKSDLCRLLNNSVNGHIWPCLTKICFETVSVLWIRLSLRFRLNLLIASMYVCKAKSVLSERRKSVYIEIVISEIWIHKTLLLTFYELCYVRIMIMVNILVVHVNSLISVLEGLLIVVKQTGNNI